MRDTIVPPVDRAGGDSTSTASGLSTRDNAVASACHAFVEFMEARTSNDDWAKYGLVSEGAVIHGTDQLYAACASYLQGYVTDAPTRSEFLSAATPDCQLIDQLECLGDQIELAQTEFEDVLDRRTLDAWMTRHRHLGLFNDDSYNRDSWQEAVEQVLNQSDSDTQILSSATGIVNFRERALAIVTINSELAEIRRADDRSQLVRVCKRIDEACSRTSLFGGMDLADSVADWCSVSPYERSGVEAVFRRLHSSQPDWVTPLLGALLPAVERARSEALRDFHATAESYQVASIVDVGAGKVDLRTMVGVGLRWLIDRRYADVIEFFGTGEALGLLHSSERHVLGLNQANMSVRTHAVEPEIATTLRSITSMSSSDVHTYLTEVARGAVRLTDNQGIRVYPQVIEAAEFADAECRHPAFERGLAEILIYSWAAIYQARSPFGYGGRDDASISPVDQRRIDLAELFSRNGITLCPPVLGVLGFEVERASLQYADLETSRGQPLSEVVNSIIRNLPERVALRIGRNDHVEEFHYFNTGNGTDRELHLPIALSDQISGTHASIIKRDGKTWVFDTGSRNGTFYFAGTGWVQIQDEPAKLDRGTEIRLANFKTRV